MGDDASFCVTTLRKAASLARMRSRTAYRIYPEGPELMGAAHALATLAEDLETAAAYEELLRSN